MPRTISPRVVDTTFPYYMQDRTVSRTAIAAVIKCSRTRQKMNIREEEDSVPAYHGAWVSDECDFSRFPYLVRRRRYNDVSRFKLSPELERSLAIISEVCSDDWSRWLKCEARECEILFYKN